MLNIESEPIEEVDLEFLRSLRRPPICTGRVIGNEISGSQIIRNSEPGIADISVAMTALVFTAGILVGFGFVGFWFSIIS